MMARFSYLIFASTLMLALPLYAQSDAPPPVPVTSVQAQPLSSADKKAMPKGEDPAAPKVQSEQVRPKQKPKRLSSILPSFDSNEQVTVLELFSTQACTFCPKADAMMADLVQRDDMIALSCHVDYFDVPEGSLSLPVCSTRQSAYEKSLDSGPKYTPQMVVNGRYDAIGYLLDEVEIAFDSALRAPVQRGDIIKKDTFLTLKLPSVPPGDYQIWSFVYDKPYAVRVKSGGNRGKNITYYNVVSKAGFLGPWDGSEKTLTFDPKFTDQAKGVAIIAQNKHTNHIIAAARYER